MVSDYIQVNGVSVTIYKPQVVRQVLVTIHGFAGDSDSSVIYALAKEMTKQGFLVIAFDLPNHGKNFSNKTLKLKDCIDMVEHINQYAIGFNVPVSYFATSFGGYLLLSVISKIKPTGKVILRAPAVFMDSIVSDVILPEHGYTIKDLEDKVDLGYQTPLLIDKEFLKDLQKNRLQKIDYNSVINVLQGKKDTVVNWKQNKEFFKNNFNGELKYFYFENADHRFKNPGELEKIIEISKNILLSKN